MTDPRDQKHFRHTLSHLPTGVTVVTAMDTGQPVGLAVGSVMSVSLDPPLVAFCPGRTSTSWPRIERAGAFCVNVLGADQEHICQTFAGKGQDKFEQHSWRAAPSGSPILDGVLAWIDCEIDAVHEAGDHWIVVGRVVALDVEDHEHAPLVFHKGTFLRL